MSDAMMEQFHDAYFEECFENLAEFEKLLLAMEATEASSEDLNGMFRAIHSIKGGAGSFEFREITEVTHEFENMLSRMRSGEMKATAAARDILLKLYDGVKTQVTDRKAKKEPDQALVKKMMSLIKVLPNVCISVDGNAAPAAVVQREEVTHRITFFPGEVSVDHLLKNLSELGAVEIHDRGGVDGEGEDRYVYPWQVEMKTTLTDKEIAARFEFLLPKTAVRVGAGHLEVREAAEKASTENTATESAAAPAAAPAPAPDAAAISVAEITAPIVEGAMSVRVPVEKVDNVINIVGELVIARSMLERSLVEMEYIENESISNMMRDLTRHTRTLQEATMSIRMMPIAFIFGRFNRMTKELAGRLNKQVQLVLEGENTELDKGMIERIADPLTHLVRNSIDHGLESAGERELAGKPAKGTIKLTAAHRGGGIVIEVVDDGRGLNRAKILEKARKVGIPTSEHMPDNEVWDIIFKPGFSTAEHVTEVSGRGVGMDVVKRNIQSIGGRIEIESRAGEGTRITIHLPLTLAIMDGMSLSVGASTYILPINSIAQVINGREMKFKRLLEKSLITYVRGEWLPVVPLHKMVGAQNAIEEPEKCIMLIVENAGKRIAMMIDELISQHQVVVKSLDDNIGRVPGVAAATIMGDGNVVMILDAAAIVQHGHKHLMFEDAA